MICASWRKPLSPPGLDLQWNWSKVRAFGPGRYFIYSRETGIRPSGASSILIPTSEWIKNEAFRHPGTPQPASDFLSLSPLQLYGSFHLSKKLNSLKPKGKRRGEDDSATNKVYFGQSDSGKFRSAFEHNRYNTFYISSFPYRIEPSHSDYSFMPPNPPLISGGSVSASPLRGPLPESFRSFSMSGLTRKA
jgi:hypothetical protein